MTTRMIPVSIQLRNALAMGAIEALKSVAKTRNRPRNGWCSIRIALNAAPMDRYPPLARVKTRLCVNTKKRLIYFTRAISHTMNPSRPNRLIHCSGRRTGAYCRCLNFVDVALTCWGRFARNLLQYRSSWCLNQVSFMPHVANLYYSLIALLKWPAPSRLIKKHELVETRSKTMEAMLNMLFIVFGLSCSDTTL